MRLTKNERAALIAINGGADVYDYQIAQTLRSMERTGSKLVRIVKAKGAPKDAAVRQPYFGAKVTAAGIRALAAV